MGRLLPLIPLAQAQNAEVALFTEHQVPDLPYEVEILAELMAFGEQVAEAAS